MDGLSCGRASAAGLSSTLLVLRSCMLPLAWYCSSSLLTQSRLCLWVRPLSRRLVNLRLIANLRDFALAEVEVDGGVQVQLQIDVGGWVLRSNPTQCSWIGLLCLLGCSHLVRIEKLRPTHVHVYCLRLGAIPCYSTQPASPLFTPLAKNAVSLLRLRRRELLRWQTREILDVLR